MTQNHSLQQRYTRGAKLALFAFGLAFIVIILGGYTRLTDAGLSCPDWPNCYGYLTAPHTADQIQDATQKYPLTPVNVKKAWTEMTHRYVAGTEGILILILCFGVLFAKKTRTCATMVIGISLIALLGVQVILGMLTVTKNLKPVIVLSHLLTGISILSMLWLAFLALTTNKLSQPITSRHPTLLKLSLWLGFFIVAAQITLGGWVSTHYAGLACIDLPYCNGQLLPPLQWDRLNDDLITIHMLHRIGAVITAVYVVGLSLTLMFCGSCGLTFRGLSAESSAVNQPQPQATTLDSSDKPRNVSTSSFFKPFAIVILLLISTQITLGVYNILWLRPVWLAMLHQGVAIVLLLTFIKALFNVGTRHVRLP